MRVNGADILIRSLIEQGVDTVFGYPGGQVLDIYDALYSHRRKIRHITTAHEQGACHAADGYARATGKVGVVISTSGPGATNLVTGIATAFLDSIPLVAITGNVDTRFMGKDSFQEVDIAGITMPITKYNYIVKDVSELESIINEAFVLAKSGRPGPVLIDIPKNIQKAKCEYIGGKRADKLADPLDLSSLNTIVELIESASKPCLYIGGGVILSDSADKVIEFADKIDAPIISSMMGLGAVPTQNDRLLGMAGMHGTYAANKALCESDLLIAIGSRFSDRATGDKSDYYNDKKIVHIDIDPAEIGKNIDADYYLIGDVGTVLTELMKSVKSQEHTAFMDRVKTFSKSEANSTRMQGDYNPETIIKSVSSRMGEYDFVATDVGQHQMWTCEYFDFKHPRTFLTSGGLGTMGFGLGASIGASIATGRRAVLFTSDGSFHMNMNELATVASYNLPVVVVVLNNNALGMVKQWQHMFYHDRYSETRLDRKTNYSALATAMGIDGYDVASKIELDKALDKVFATNKPALIACSISADEMVLPMIPPNSNTKQIVLKDNCK